MSNNKRKYILDLLDELYREHSSELMTISNSDPWPVIRIQAGYAMILLAENKINLNINLKKLNFKKDLVSSADVFCLIKKTARLFLWNFRKKILNDRVLLFGFQEHYYGKKSEKVNLYITPFKKELNKKNIECEEFLISNKTAEVSANSDLSNLYGELSQYHQLFSKVKNSWNGNNRNAFENAKLVENFLSAKNIQNPEHIASIVYRAQLEQETEFCLFRQFLRLTSPKLVWTYCFYDNSVMALVRAANYLNIKTVEYQHSAQSDDHNAYSKWQEPHKYKTYFPNTFWVWKKEDEERVIRNFSNKSFSPNVIAGGNLAIIQHNSNLNLNKASNFTVLVSLQGLWIPSFVEEIVSKMDNYKWYFRLHPRYPEDKLKLVELKNRFPDRIETDDANQLSLYELFDKVGMCVTDFSGVALEAAEFGIKTIIIGNTGAEIYKEEIAKGIFTLAIDEESFIEKLSKGSARNRDAKEVEKRKENLNYLIDKIAC